jgi:predicted dehydrogenase
VEKEKKVRVGVIGLGKMGILHTALVNMIPQAELAALSDINKQLARYVEQSGLRAPFFSDLAQMLSEIALDAAFICTPAFTNLAVVETCLKKDLDLFVEKPLAHTFEDAKKMAALAAASKNVHATGYLFAHMSLFKKAKGLLDTKVIGRVHRFKSSMYTSEVFGRKKGWYYDKAKSGGGAVINIASHLLYLVYWYFGRPASVFARARSIYSDGVEDDATALMEFSEGVSGSLDVSWSVPGYRLPYMDLSIEGDNGTLELTNDYIKLYLYKAQKSFPKEWTTIHKIDMPVSSPFELGAEGLYEEDLDFIGRCLDRTPAAVTWQDGLEVQRIIEAIYRSADRQKVIFLNEVD